ncbi:MAK10-like protein [Tanacetum coccineum]
MEDPEQAFVEYASSRTDEAGGKWYTFKPEQCHLGDTYNPSWRSHPNLRWRQPQNSQNNFSNPPNWFQPNSSIPNHARLSKFEADFKQQQSEMTNKIDTVLKAITNQIAGTLPSDTVKNPKLGTHRVLSARSYPTQDPQCSNHVHGSINAITIHPKQPEGSQVNRPDEGQEKEVSNLRYSAFWNAFGGKTLTWAHLERSGTRLRPTTNISQNFYSEARIIFHQKSVPRTPQQNGVVERRNRTLVEAARTMLIFSKAMMFLSAEAVAGTPSSTTIDQDAPSTSHSPSSSVVQRPISHQEPSSEESSSGDVSSAESTQVIQPHDHLRKCSKDHLMDNVIGNPSRLVSTRKQLATDALWCLYNSVLSKFEPKNVKTAMDEACWFKAIQEEIYEFDRLRVWELVPKPDCVMIIALK